MFAIKSMDAHNHLILLSLGVDYYTIWPSGGISNRTVMIENRLSKQCSNSGKKIFQCPQEKHESISSLFG